MTDMAKNLAPNRGFLGSHYLTSSLEFSKYRPLLPFVAMVMKIWEFLHKISHYLVYLRTMAEKHQLGGFKVVQFRFHWNSKKTDPGNMGRSFSNSSENVNLRDPENHMFCARLLAI